MVQVFRYCFYLDMGKEDGLQEFLQWDTGKKSTPQSRRYRYVYFLRNPERPQGRTKRFFLKAFDRVSATHFFSGQKYIGDEEIEQARLRTGNATLEAFLGLDA